jgi:hypothetical protein
MGWLPAAFHCYHVLETRFHKLLYLWYVHKDSDSLTNIAGEEETISLFVDSFMPIVEEFVIQTQLGLLEAPGSDHQTVLLRL